MGKNTDLLLWGEIIDDVEELTNLFWGLPLNHVCHRLAPNVANEVRSLVVSGTPSYDRHIQKRFYVEIVGCENDLE